MKRSIAAMFVLAAVLSPIAVLADEEYYAYWPYPCNPGSRDSGCGDGDGVVRVMTSWRDGKWSYEVWRSDTGHQYEVRRWENNRPSNQMTESETFSSLTDAQRFFEQNYGNE